MKRPRSNYAATCYNCGRGGVLPANMLTDDDGNRFCTTECGWSYLLATPTIQAERRDSTRQLTSPVVTDQAARIRQDCANADRVQYLLLKRLRRDPRYNAAMRRAAIARAARGVVLPHDTPSPPRSSVRRPTPTRHTEHALFAFSRMFDSE